MRMNELLRCVEIPRRSMLTRNGRQNIAMKLGDLEFHILTDGTFRLDGGAMFGVIPKPMWERVSPADDRNRILLAMNSLLIRAAGKWILVETGAGDKWDAKRPDIYAFEGARLPDNLAAHGVPREDRHRHQHAPAFRSLRLEHARRRRQTVPTFPNARYIVQRGELEHARHPSERDRASYFPENFEPMAETGQWSLLDGDAESCPASKLIRMPGHNARHDVRAPDRRRQDGIFLADLVPTTAHIRRCPGSWATISTRCRRSRTRRSGLPEIARQGLAGDFRARYQSTPARSARERRRQVDRRTG